MKLRNAPRLTGGTPATRRRKVGGRSGSPHRGRRARRGVSGAPNRRALRPARGGGGRTAPATTSKAFFLRMPGRSAANPMRQCTNAKTVTTSFVRVYPLVALQCGPAPNRYRCVTRRQLTGYAMSWRQQASRPIQCTSCTGSMPLRGEKKKVCVVFLRCAGEADERLPLGKSVQLCAYLLFVGALAARLSDG